MAEATDETAEPLDPVALLEVLLRHQVRFVVIGGIAAISHGYPLPTEDVDVTPSRDRENLERLARALRELGARLRSASDATGVPFPIDADMLRRAESWTLRTRLGDLDIMFELTIGQPYEMLGRDAEFVYVALQRDPRLVTLPAGELIPIACQYPGAMEFVGGPREKVLGCGSLHSLGRRLWGLPDLLEAVKRVGSVGITNGVERGGGPGGSAGNVT